MIQQIVKATIELCTFFNITSLQPYINILFNFSVYDTETTQDMVLEKGQAVHQVNYLAAQVFCTRCITDNRWKLDTEGCEICGPHRFLSFAPFDLPDNSLVDYHCNTETPVAAFVQWILLETNANFETQAFAHNAGRFG
jgi:hypothetical protein